MPKISRGTAPHLPTARRPGTSSGPFTGKPASAYGAKSVSGSAKMGGGSKEAWRQSRMNPHQTHRGD